MAPFADERWRDTLGRAPRRARAKWLDLLMLTLAAGRERTEAQWQALLAQAGWQPSRFGRGLVEARPV